MDAWLYGFLRHLDWLLDWFLYQEMNIEEHCCWGTKVYVVFPVIFLVTFFLWSSWCPAPVHRKVHIYQTYVFFVKFTKKNWFCSALLFLKLLNWNVSNNRSSYSLAIATLFLFFIFFYFFLFGVMVGASSSRPWVTPILPPRTTSEWRKSVL